MDRASRILWVTDEPPDRTLGGGSIRQAHLLEALAQAFPTDLLTAGARPEERVRELVEDVTELPRRTAPWTEHPVGRRALSLAIALGSRDPSPVYPTRSVRRDLAKEIDRRRGHYALVCVEHEALAPVIPELRGERWILTFHNLLSGMIESELEPAPGRRQRWFRERDLAKATALERRALSRYDRCVVCSDEDAAALSEIAGPGTSARFSVVPNGVDLEALRPTPLPAEPRILLPGHLAWQPNVDGAVWFCAEVWELVRAAVPNATLMLVGREPAPEVLALERVPGVSVHANVPSMAAYFESARAVVVPLKVGTGTRLKALEGMAAGRPVIGTAVGLGGIGAVHRVHALFAEDPESFASAVTEALRRDELAESLARNGRDYVVERFGWDRIGREFVTTVSELLGGEVRPAIRASSSDA
ncbi:MAG TPA: glycosyltransferase family 4 protein [Solirubrobacteraceae bacterium]|jgi:glycosyltransferase involved in cell wall biosynthesis